MAPSITIVTPWMGTGSPGGAERLAHTLAVQLTAHGWDTTIGALTSGGPHTSWAQPAFDRGESLLSGVRIWREHPDERDARRYDLINYRILHHMPIQPAEEEAFFRQSINSTALLEWIAEHRPNDLLLVLPYPTGLALTTVATFGPRVVLMPCLHREGYARMHMIQWMLENAGALVFLTPEERNLAHALADVELRPHMVSGCGLDGAWSAIAPITDERRTTAQRRFAQGRPYLACIGWQDVAKGIDFLYEVLLDAHHALKAMRVPQPAPHLILAGPGHVPVPPGLARHVTNLNYISHEEKVELIAGAEWLIHPGQRESFGLVLFEAWTLGTPVIVNALCDVTRGQTARAGGGLYVASGDELAGVWRWGIEHPRERQTLARQGQAYAQRHGSWEAILAHLDPFLRERYDAVMPVSAAGDLAGA